MRKRLAILLGVALGVTGLVGCAPGVIGGIADGTGGTPGTGVPNPGSGVGPGTGSGGSTRLGTGGVTGGGTGTGGAGNAVVSGTGGTGTSVVASGLPCDVQTILQAHCTSCHGSTLAGGAPMALVTYANLTARSTTDPTLTFAQRAIVRAQAATAPMPPTGPRLTPAEILTLTNWIASLYPMGTCGSTTTGSGGSAGGPTTGTGGAVGPAGTGGSTGSGGVVGTAATLPCDIQTFLQARCTTCHGATLAGGAPMALVTYANVRAPSTFSAAQTYAQRALVRIQDNATPMPPVPGTRATTAETQALSTWIAAGYPSGGTCAGGAGTGGAAGGVPDPLSRPAVCTSNTFWTGGNNGNVLMNPGRACINCHASGGGGDDGAPRYTIAGTVYPTGHEPDLCNGGSVTTAAQVVIVDGANRTITLTPNAAGNFFYSGALTTPFHAKVTYQGRERIMTTAQTSGDCNGCHTQNGASGAPGRITLP